MQNSSYPDGKTFKSTPKQNPNDKFGQVDNMTPGGGPGSCPGKSQVPVYTKNTGYPRT